MLTARPAKPAEFIGSSREDMRGLPREVRYVFGYALFLAQTGGKQADAKPLRGVKEFKGAGVILSSLKPTGDKVSHEKSD